jgi:hypothetical protein
MAMLHRIDGAQKRHRILARQKLAGEDDGHVVLADAEARAQRLAFSRGEAAGFFETRVVDRPRHEVKARFVCAVMAVITGVQHAAHEKAVRDPEDRAQQSGPQARCERRLRRRKAAVAEEKNRRSAHAARGDAEERGDGAPAEEEDRGVVAMEEQRRRDARVDQPRIAVAESEVAQEAMFVAAEEVEIPAESGLHLRIAVDLCAVGRAEEDLQIEFRLLGQQPEKRRLVLDDVGCDERDAVHASTLS